MTTAAARRVSVDRRAIPAEGLGRDDIHLALDRRAVRRSSSAALDASGWTLGASVAFPFLVGAASGTRGAAERAAICFQASFAADAVTVLLKRSIARPRPMLYRPQARSGQTPDDWYFESFPSGHATRAGSAVGVGVLDHLGMRPGAAWAEHFAVGLLGGTLASATGALRVEGGVHFPTDAAAGVLTGLACGAGVSLLQGWPSSGGGASRPPRSAWFASWGGVCAGAVLTAAAASFLGPG